MTTIYHDDDGDLDLIRGRTIAVVGYGNQGRSWALNLRDSGADVRVCVRADETRDEAQKDGFETGELAEASEIEIACVLVPDDAISQLPIERPDDGLTITASGFEGYLQTDGYEGYTALGNEPGVHHVGCWAHARRKFDEALRGQGGGKKKGTKKSAKESKARQALSQIQALYAIERTLKDVSVEERYAVRQERSRPLIEKLRQWLDASRDSVPPQSLTGKAMTYLDRQWPKLVRVLEDGRLPLDTNAVENVIRPFVLGRKNWLFADTMAGAKASANLYGLIETAKANGIEPWRYLCHLFEALPLVDAAEQLDALLPHRLDPGVLAEL